MSEPAPPSIWSGYRKVWTLLAPRQKRSAALVILVMFVAALLGMASVGGIYPFLLVLQAPESIAEDGYLGDLYRWGGFSSTSDFLVALGFGVLALIVAAAAARAGAEAMHLRFSARLSHEIGSRLIEEYARRPYSFFLRSHSANLSNQVIQEADAFSNGFVEMSLVLVFQVLMIGAIVGFLIVVNPVVTLLLMSVLGGTYALMYLILSRRLTRIGNRYIEATRERMRVVSELFGSIKAVKALGREDAFVGRFKPVSETVASSMARKKLLGRVPKFALEMLGFGGILVILLVLLLQGREVGAILPFMGMFVFGAYRLMPSIHVVIDAHHSVRFFRPLVDRVHHDLQGPEAQASHARAKIAPTPIRLQREVRFEHVTYAYPGADRPSLVDVDISIRAGEAVAFVGRTGAGKTTLVDVLLGLLEPDKGSVIVDGKPLDDKTRLGWLRSIGYVPQDIVLTDDTISRNIAFGVPESEIDQAAVERAARIAHIHGFITSELAQGYASRVGERGIRLSGGQRQRIGIARALYADPAILVLDEATSEIDGATESGITSAIDELAGTKTVFVIAHRLQTIRKVDRIFLVEGGRIIESGTYDELLARSPRFRELAQHAPSAEGESVGGAVQS